MKKGLYILVTCTVLTCLMACSETPFFEKQVDIPDGNWSYKNKPVYNVSISDTTQLYDLFLEIDHSFDFSYQNMYIKITTGFPNIEDKEERLSIDLANKKGEWVGECNSSNCIAKVYLLENFKFADAGNYAFTLEQLSREPSLSGVYSLSLQIIESKAQVSN